MSRESQADLLLVIDAEQTPRGVARLVRSLDLQTLPSAAFDVVFLVSDLASPASRRLQDLAARRPNVAVVAGRDPGTVAGVIAGTARSWVIAPSTAALRRLPYFHRDAFVRLLDVANTADADIVLGRAGVPAGHAVVDVLTVDSPTAEVTPSELLAAGVTVYRTSVAVAHGVATDEPAAQAVHAATNRIAVLAAYSCVSERTDGDPAESSMRLDSAEAGWEDGRIVVRVRGSAGTADEARRVRFGLRHVRRGMDYLLADDCEVCADGTFEASGAIDPRTAALGEPLSDGRWQVTVGVHGVGSCRSRRMAVPAPSIAPAVVEGKPVSTSVEDGSFMIDVGARTTPVVTRIDASDVSITESVRGTLLRAELPTIVTHGAGRLPGKLLLDDFALPASLVSDGGQAHIECYLSGLAGTSRLSTRFGGAGAQPSGLTLHIGGDGVMTSRPTPPPPVLPAARSGEATSAPSGSAEASAGPTTAVRLRDRVPAGLQPAVRTLAQNETARRIYHRLATRRS